MIEFIALFFLKHKDRFGVPRSKFEEDFHVKLRNHLCVYSSSSYFHSFMGRKLEVLIS